MGGAEYSYGAYEFPGWLSGLTKKGISKHRTLIPIHFCTVMGSLVAVGFSFRSIVYHPDASVNRWAKPYPNQDYECKQYKFMAPTVAYKDMRVPEERPNID